jgi:hypothetical protein
MAGLVPAIYVIVCGQDVDARDKPGHDVDGRMLDLTRRVAF